VFLATSQSGQVKVLLVITLDVLVDAIANIVLLFKEVTLPRMPIPRIDKGEGSALAISRALILAFKRGVMDCFPHMRVSAILCVTVPD
jgi:hypothetical protein